MNLLSSRFWSMSLLLVTLSANSVNGQEVNLITNGGFETPIAEGAFWKLNYGATQETGGAFAGERAVKLTRTAAGGSIRHNVTTDFIPYDDKPVNISLQWKSEGIKQGKESWHIGLFHIVFYDKDKKRNGSHSAVASIKGDNDWAKAQKTYYPASAKKASWQSVPAGTKYTTLEIVLLDCTGTLWIDDVKMVKLP